MIDVSNQMQENMRRAQQRDAVHQEKFYFRKSVVPEDDEEEEEEGEKESLPKSHDHEFTEMTLDTIVNGKVIIRTCLSLPPSHPPFLPPSFPPSLSFLLHVCVKIIVFLWQDEFPGLIPLVRMYVNSIDIDVDTRCTVMQYLRLMSERASG